MAASDTIIDILRSVYNSTDGALKTDVTSGLVPAAYDYIAVTYPTSASEAYAFRSGGVSGTLIATVTVTYSDSSKNSLTSVAKT